MAINANDIKKHAGIKKEQGEQDKFCDNNCVWTDHHSECVYNNDTLEERVDKTRENVHEPEWYHVIDVHGCNRFYHRTEDCPYKVKTPLYTTPYVPEGRQQRTWVGLGPEEIRKTNHHMVDGAYHYSFKQGAKWVETKLKEKNTK